MATVDESTLAKTPMGSDLASGVETLSLDQQVTFTQYVRLVLPLDGFVFYVRPNLLTSSALFNATKFNASIFNQPPLGGPTDTTTFVVNGSLHYATEVRQEEGEVYGANRVIFTSDDEVNELNTITPGTLWIGKPSPGDDQALPRFAFSTQTTRYRQANIWHYVGFAVYPDMEPQIVDSVLGFDRALVVSNSLPAWLALQSYRSLVVPDLAFPLFPSHLAPLNEPPPFASVHVSPDGTRPLGAIPRITAGGTSSQLCSDKVRLTLWGVRNDQAIDFLNLINDYSENTAAFGIMDEGAIRDDKRTQSELQTIAQKKTLEIEVSYYQSRMNTLAQQLIESAVVDFIPSSV